MKLNKFRALEILHILAAYQFLADSFMVGIATYHQSIIWEKLINPTILTDFPLTVTLTAAIVLGYAQIAIFMLTTLPEMYRNAILAYRGKGYLIKYPKNDSVHGVGFAAIFVIPFVGTIIFDAFGFNDQLASVVQGYVVFSCYYAGIATTLILILATVYMKNRWRFSKDQKVL